MEERLACRHDGVEVDLQTEVLLALVEAVLRALVVGLELDGGLAAGGQAVERAQGVELAEQGLGVVDPLDEADLLGEAGDALGGVSDECGVMSDVMCFVYVM